MPLCLIVPDLFWPRPDLSGPAAGLSLPGLEYLLAGGEAPHAAPQSVDTTLLNAFGLNNAAMAPLRLAGEGLPAGDTPLFCADPMHLRLMREAMVLADPADLNIASDEADALIAALNLHFAEEGEFQAPCPTRWYFRPLTPPGPDAFRATALADAIGHDVNAHLPRGEEGGSWLRKLLNEAQMLLFDHPVNIDREKRGEPAINSLWLWGGGVLPAAGPPPFAHVWSNTPLAKGLAHLSGIPALPVPKHFEVPSQDGLVLCDALQMAISRADPEGWRSLLCQLEDNWFFPLSKALHDGTVPGLTLISPCLFATLRWQIDAPGTLGRLRTLLKKPRAFAAWHASLSASLTQ